MRSAKNIWELAIIPSLLNNSGTWDICDKSVVTELEKFQSYFFQQLLQVPNSCPRPGIAYEANLLKMKYRVYGRVLNFIKHVHSHIESNLSHQVLSEQLNNDWPGQAQTAKQIMMELGITGLLDTMVSKSKFKGIVKNSCEMRNKESLNDDIQNYKKMKALRDEIVKGNAYFFNENLHNVRTIFRFRMELFEAKLNFKQKPEYKSEGYMCDSCEREIDENTHVLFCPSYKSLREGKDLYSDSDLSEYLRKVLIIRSELRLNR